MTSLQPQPPRRGRRREGNITFIETTFETRVRMMIAFVARREAREIVKRRLKAQGVKLSLTRAMTITQLATPTYERTGGVAGASGGQRGGSAPGARIGAPSFPCASQNAADGASAAAVER